MEVERVKVMKNGVRLRERKHASELSEEWNKFLFIGG